MEKNQDFALSTQARKHLEKLKNADILVGIPSYNNAHTINYVIYQAAKGLETYFPNLKSTIFVADGNSNDGTLKSVGDVRFPFQVRVIPATYAGLSGKGSAVRAIFEAARFLGVRAVAHVDSDLRSITPEWIKLLISPALSGTGLVTPFYVRHKYDGAITNFLCYPVISSLYGKRIRQPIGGDFGFSKHLVLELLESPLWQMSSIRRFGIDIFETCTALSKNFDVKQASLGKKVHEAKDPAKHLASMFEQVAASLFTCIEKYDKAWKKIHGSQNVEIVGEQFRAYEPEKIPVNLKNLMKAYKEGFCENRGIYRIILEKKIFRELEVLGKLKENEITLSKESWAKIVYIFCANFKNREGLEREKLLNALRILWIGKVANFVKETSGLSTEEAEKKIEEEARIFERLKPYLLKIT